MNTDNWRAGVKVLWAAWFPIFLLFGGDRFLGDENPVVVAGMVEYALIATLDMFFLVVKPTVSGQALKDAAKDAKAELP